MVPSFVRKLTSWVKSKRNGWKLRSAWARPNLEALDDRVLPSVTATLGKGGVLKVIADTHQGTQQVEIIQAQNQITVEDGGAAVNSFDISQVQQIDFKYREGHQQHSHIDLDIAVNQTQMTLTGFSVNEADLNLGSNPLAAAVRAMLPDSTAVRLAGPVNADGTFDLAGSTGLLVVGSVPLILPHFDLTDQGMTVEGHTILPVVGAADFTGSLTPDGTYALTAPLPDFTVSGYTLTNASAGLSNNGLTITATTTVPIVGDVNLTGDLTVDGHYSLTASVPTVNVLGFTLNNVSVTLDDAHDLTFGATSTLPVVGDVTFAGSATPDGHYSLSATAGDFTVFGFTLTNVSVTLDNVNGLTVTANANLPLAGTAAFAGHLAPDGSYSLTASLADFAVQGFTLTSASATLDNVHGLTLDASANVPVLNNITLDGSLTSNGQYSLTATATSFMLFGFTFSNVTATLNNNGFSVSGEVTLPVTGDITVSGSVTSDGQYSFQGTAANVTILGFVLSNLTATVNNAGVSVEAHATLPVINTIDLSGQVQSNGNYSLTATVTNASFLGFTFNTVTATFTNAGMTFGIDATLPIVNAVHLSGQVQANGNFSVVATVPSVTLFGVTLANVTATLDNNSLTAAADATIPLVGTVHVSGTIQANGNYNLTASAPNLSILGFTLTNVSVSLANLGGLTVTAHAAGIPLLGTVDFTGTISGGNFSFTATLPSVSVLGFTLTNLNVTLTSSSLAVSAHAAALPLVGTVDFSGTINASGFTLTATATNIDVLGFIHFNSIALTLNNTSLSLSAATSLPIVGDVTFTGAVNASGTFTISATAPQFTLLGFLTFNNATVSLSFPNPSLTVSAGIDLLNIGHVAFSGTISAGGHYTFTATASLTVAGFTLGSGTLTITDAPASCINIGPFTTLPLPVLGRVTIQGSYCGGGVFSFDLDINPSPPLVIAGIPFNRFHFGLTNDSLTFGAGVGINFSGLNIASAYLQGTIHTNGDFSFLAQVSALSIANFNAVMGTLTFSDTAGQYSLTLHATAQFLVANVVVDGSIDFNRSQFTLTGSATIGVAGFTLSSTSFRATNIGGLQIDLHSHTSIPNFANIDFDGTLAKAGTSYAIAVHATANVTVAGFNLVSARLDLDNTHLAITVHYVQAGAFTVDFSGTMSSGGAFDLSGSASLGLAGFVSVANASFHLTNTSLTISAQMNLKVANVNLTGTFQSNGQFSLTGSGAVSLGGFTPVTGSFTLTNSGATVSARVDVRVAMVSFSGSIRTDGSYAFQATAVASFAGFNWNTTFTISNAIGVSVSTRMTFSVMGFTASFSGTVSPSGAFSFTAGTGLHFGPIDVSLSLTLNNSGFRAQVHASLDISANVGVGGWSVHVGFRGSFDVGFGINTNGSFTANGSVTMTAYAGITLSVGIGFTITNQQITVHTHDIGFSLWGVNFRPFDDLNFSY